VLAYHLAANLFMPRSVASRSVNETGQMDYESQSDILLWN
jgi:hypothetical protein